MEEEEGGGEEQDPQSTDKDGDTAVVTDPSTIKTNHETSSVYLPMRQKLPVRNLLSKPDNAAGLAHHTCHVKSVPKHIALHDWLQITWPLIYQNFWNVQLYEEPHCIARETKGEFSLALSVKTCKWIPAPANWPLLRGRMATAAVACSILSCNSIKSFNKKM